MAINLVTDTDGSSLFRDSANQKEVLRLTSGGGAYVDPEIHVQLLDHFLGDVLADQWSGAAGTDAQAVAPAITAAEGGWVRLTTGDTVTAAESISSLTHALNWKAENGGLRFKTTIKPVTSVADVKYFIGLTDALATGTLEIPITLSGTTLTTNATDAVGFVYDTAATNDYWHCQGVKNDTDTALTNTSIGPSAGTEQTLEIRVDTSGGAEFFIGGQLVASVANCVTASVALTPIVAALTNTTTSKSIDADYVFVQSRR